MTALVVLLSIALAVCLGFLIFGKGTQPPAPAVQDRLQAETKAREQAQADAERRRRELDDQKRQVQELREELKQTKRKLFEQKEGEKGQRDLTKARLEEQRSAVVQLEAVRAELAGALAEIDRLKASAAGGPRRRPAEEQAKLIVPPPATPAPELAAPAAVPTPVEPPKPERRFRELNDADREKMQRLEHEAKRERSRAMELDKELRRLKGKVETQSRVYNVTKGELDLTRDKYKALEKRLNRVLLESDLVRRALRDLESRTGSHPARVTLTQEEQAASDKQVDDRLAAEAETRAADARAAAANAESPESTASAEPPSEPETREGEPAVVGTSPSAEEEHPGAHVTNGAESPSDTRSAASEGSEHSLREPSV